MGIYVIGVNYRTTPVQIREKFNIDSEEHVAVLSSIKQLAGITECALLSTCNRTELHIFSEGTLLDTGHIEKHLCALKGIDIYQVKKFFYVYEGLNAIKHIMKVASGMDSMLLGEDQILGQFKKAYELSMKQGASKAVLNTLSRLAITSSKKIKTRNLMLCKVSSVAGQVGDLLVEQFGKELADKNILIIGSGEIGNMVCEKLTQIGVADIFLTQRSRYEDKIIIKNESEVKTINYNDRYLYIEQCDVIIGATSSPHYTITLDILEETIVNKDRSHIFIDLAVPRDFDEEICQLDNVNLYNIDDMKNIVCKNIKGTKQLDLHYVHEQINSYADEFIRWFQYRNAFVYGGGN
jgi:glutamyl-tRNA reductase